MLGGTIWTDQGFGANPGLLMRRGTLIGPNVEKLLATFVDTGKHDLVDPAGALALPRRHA